MRTHLSIRSKLMLVALLLFLIPWMSYLYVRDMKIFLLSGQESALALTARAIATVLHDRPELFANEEDFIELGDPAEEKHLPTALNESAISKLSTSEQGDDNTPPTHSNNDQKLNNELPQRARLDNSGTKELTAVPLPNYINLNGDLSDWGALASDSHRDLSTRASENSNLEVAHQLGYHGRYIYAYFSVIDDKVILRRPGFLRVDAADHIRITLQDPGRDPRRFTLIARENGRMSIYLMDDDWRYPITGEPNYDLAAELKTTDEGYTVELRIPRFLLSSGTGIQVVIADVDDPDTLDISNLLSITSESDSDDSISLLVQSVEISKILTALNRDDSRIWVLDQNQSIKAVVGKIASNSFQFKTNRPRNNGDTLDHLMQMARYYYNAGLSYIFRLIEDKPTGDTRFFEESFEQRNDEIINRALHGEVSNDRRPSADLGTVLMSAHPVYLGDDVLGAVIVEQSTHQILQQQQSLLENVVSVTLLVLLTVVGAILFFASRLTMRIRRLRNATDNAIDHDGRIVSARLSSDARSGDEIGDLSRSISNMLVRLSQYTSYLRGLPDTLAHEVSNPLNVVNSSLHNLAQENPTVAGSKYLDRATNGVNRIGSILHNLTEAANLEQALQSETREVFDLAELIENYVDGYTMSNPKQTFDVVIHSRPLMTKAAPDYIAQMLDKLVDNAIDFAAPGTDIVFKLQRLGQHAQIDVINFGSRLPEGMSEQIFEPLVSLGRKDAQKTRLGMGLYVVKLIANFHGGDVIARNLTSSEGVIFSFSLPIHYPDNIQI